MIRTALRTISILALILLGFAACTRDSPDNSDKNSIRDDITPILNSTFRIDIDSINVEFDYSPEDYLLEGRATVKFLMRTGQKRPLIHFNPGTRDINCIKLIKLNNQQINIGNEVKIIGFDNTTQKALEFQKDLPENSTHTLYMEYELKLQQGNYIFITDVNDIKGIGNEEFFPTINSPQELASHEIKFRNMSSIPMRIIGSGNITENRESSQQEWLLKPVTPISSYTLMFALAPEEDIDYQEKTINGVDVKMMSYKGLNLFDQAIEYLEQCLPEYENYLGPFPMPEGLSLFIVDGFGGMEYYGGSITSNMALKHEVFHMYFACSVVNRTYRDSWLDEAITVWYEKTYDQFSPGAIHDGYRSNIVSGRSPVEIGFDTRAYNDGARIITAVSDRLRIIGKDDPKEDMMKFLKYLYDNYRFKPYTTIDFIDYFKNYSGIDLEEEFTQWVFSDTGSTRREEVAKTALQYSKKFPNLTPPQEIRAKYGTRNL